MLRIPYFCGILGYNAKFNFFWDNESDHVCTAISSFSFKLKISVQKKQLKRSGLIHPCYTNDGVVHIKKSEHGKAIKVHHTKSLFEQFPEFVFFDDDECDLLVDASTNVSGQSSYWSNSHSCVLESFIFWFVVIHYQSYQS